jgi:hypothetical protein
MRFYFEQWKYKHPNPTDLIKTLQYYLNADLKWFESELFLTNHKIDYKIVSHKLLSDKSHVILVKNKNMLLGPVSISGYKDGKLVGSVWYNGFKGKRVFEFPPSNVDEFIIDSQEFIPELNRSNNRLKTTGLFRRIEPLQFNFLGKLDDPHFTQINYLPILGYNQYNKFMLGCAIYNYSFLQKPIEFTIAPMFAFGSKTPTGFADFTKHFTQNNNLFQEINFIGKTKTFSTDFVETKYFNETNNTSISSFNLNYYKISATLEFELKKRNPRSKMTQFISYTSNHLWVDELYALQNSIVASLSKKNKYTIINRFQYTIRNKQIINPYNVSFNFDHNDKFGKASLELNYSISFKKEKSLDFRIFAGAFVYGNNHDKSPYRFRMRGINGYQDYLFDYNYVGRNEPTGLGFAQFTENDGAFKVWTPLGQTSKWLLTVNIKSPTVGKLPLKLFADIGASEFNESLNKDKILYTAGVELCIFRNICEIYFPLIYSKDIKTALQANNKDSFFDTIRFTLNLHNIKPKNIISNNFF